MLTFFYFSQYKSKQKALTVKSKLNIKGILQSGMKIRCVGEKSENAADMLFFLRPGFISGVTGSCSITSQSVPGQDTEPHAALSAPASHTAGSSPGPELKVSGTASDTNLLPDQYAEHEALLWQPPVNIKRAKRSS